MTPLSDPGIREVLRPNSIPEQSDIDTEFNRENGELGGMVACFVETPMSKIGLRGGIGLLCSELASAAMRCQ